MTFAAPSYFWLLLLLPLFPLGAWLAQVQRGHAWKKLVAPRLQKQLATPAPALPKWLSLGIALLATALLIAALAQPVGREREVTSFVKGRNLIVAIDTSRSMLVSDVSPSRLLASKSATYDLLESFPSDHIGLMAFAGTAFLQVPLTIDHKAFLLTLDQLDESIVPSGGSNLAEAVRLATRTLKESGNEDLALIIFSDGELHAGDLKDASAEAKRAGIFTVTVGVGTSDGGFVPDDSRKDNRFRDREGRPVLSTLNPTPLRELAQETSGFYLQGIPPDFVQQIEKLVESLESSSEDKSTQTKVDPLFQFFLLPAIFLFIVALLIRGLSNLKRARPPGSATPAWVQILLLGFTLTLVAFPKTASAKDYRFFNISYRESAKKAESAAEAGEYDKASSLYLTALSEAPVEEQVTLAATAGDIAMKAGDHDSAVQAYTQALLTDDQTLQAHVHHQLANALYQQTGKAVARHIEATQSPPREDSEEEEELVIGLQLSVAEAIPPLEDCLAHYDEAIKLDPDNKKIPSNREAVNTTLEELKKLLPPDQEPQDEEEQEKQEEEQKQEEESQEQEEEEKSDEESQEEEQQEENSSEEQESEGEGEPEEEQESESEESENESSEESEEQESGEDREESEESEREGERSEQDDQSGEGENSESEEEPSEGESAESEDSQTGENENSESNQESEPSEESDSQPSDQNDPSQTSEEESGQSEQSEDSTSESPEEINETSPKDTQSTGEQPEPQTNLGKPGAPPPRPQKPLTEEEIKLANARKKLEEHADFRRQPLRQGRPQPTDKDW